MRMKLVNDITIAIAVITSIPITILICTCVAFYSGWCRLKKKKEVAEGQGDFQRPQKCLHGSSKELAKVENCDE